MTERCLHCGGITTEDAGEAHSLSCPRYFTNRLPRTQRHDPTTHDEVHLRAFDVTLGRLIRPDTKVFIYVRPDADPKQFLEWLHTRLVCRFHPSMDIDAICRAITLRPRYRPMQSQWPDDR